MPSIGTKAFVSLSLLWNHGNCNFMWHQQGWSVGSLRSGDITLNSSSEFQKKSSNKLQLERNFRIHRKSSWKCDSSAKMMLYLYVVSQLPKVVFVVGVWGLVVSGLELLGITLDNREPKYSRSESNLRILNHQFFRLKIFRRCELYWLVDSSSFIQWHPSGYFCEQKNT